MTHLSRALQVLSRHGEGGDEHGDAAQHEHGAHEATHTAKQDGPGPKTVTAASRLPARALGIRVHCTPTPVRLHAHYRVWPCVHASSKAYALVPEQYWGKCAFERKKETTWLWVLACHSVFFSFLFFLKTYDCISKEAHSASTEGPARGSATHCTTCACEAAAPAARRCTESHRTSQPWRKPTGSWVRCGQNGRVRHKRKKLPVPLATSKKKD